MPRPVALYDDECGFCTRSIAKVRRLPFNVDYRPLQAEPLAEHGISLDQALELMALVQADGSVVFGHLAWAGILRSGPPPLSWLGWLMQRPPVGPVAQRIYRWVAANRHRLPGGTAACAMPE